MVKKTAQKQHTDKALTVHGLLGSLSYWGTTARFMFVGIFIVFAFILNLSNATTAQYVDGEIILLVYGLATLLLLDLGYVVAARALPLSRVADRWIIMMSDLLLAAIFVIPSLIQTGLDGNKLRIVSLVIALFILSLRTLVGLLFAKRK